MVAHTAKSNFAAHMSYNCAQVVQFCCLLLASGVLDLAW